MPLGLLESEAIIAFKCSQAKVHAKIILCLEPSQLTHTCSLDPEVI